MNFRGHLLAYVLIPALILSGATSYYRYIVTNDYTVEYQGECDPATESCFEGCEDDECEETYAYKVMRKYGADLRAECGQNITDCEVASTCLPEDRECSVEYCDPNTVSENESCVIPEETEEGAGEEEYEMRTDDLEESGGAEESTETL